MLKERDAGMLLCVFHYNRASQSRRSIQQVGHEGLLTITDYKNIASHVADTNAALPDKLNTFFSRFEHRNDQAEPQRTTRVTYMGLFYKLGY